MEGHRLKHGALASLGVGIALLTIVIFLRGGDEPPGWPRVANEPGRTTDPVRATLAEPRPGLERSGVEAQDAPPSDPTGLAHVRGRCLAAETGSPLAGCAVSFSGTPSSSEAMALHGEVRWDAPEPVVTGADGRFDLAFVAMPPYQHVLEVHFEGRVPRTARWGPFEPGEVDDLGDIALQPGYEMRGRVVDESGAPVRAGVTVQNLPFPIRDDMAANNSRTGFSDEITGDFTIKALLPAGTWSIEASTRGFLHVSPSSVTVREGTGADPVLVVVKRMPTISGSVVDQDGRPADGVRISAIPEGSGRFSSATTGTDGSFVLYAVRPDPQPVHLQFEGGRGYEPLEDGRRYEWGSSGLSFQVARSGSFELTVVERGTNRPVEQYSVIAHALNARSSLQTRPRLGGVHPDGKVTVNDVWGGKNTLRVLPNEPTLLFSEEIEFEAFATGIPPIVVELERMQLHGVRVVAAGREPVSGSLVELIRTGSWDFDAHSRAPDARRGQQTFSSSPGFRSHALLGRETTDGDGKATIAFPADPTDLILRVTGRAHLPALRTWTGVPADGTPVEIVVSPGGTLSGVVLLSGIDAGRVSLTLRQGDGRRLNDRDREATLLQSDGRFRVEGLPPGDYAMGLAVSVQYQSETGGGARDVVLADELQRVQVEAGQEVEVRLDATRYVPGSVGGRVFLDGVPLVDGRVLIQGTGDTRGRYGQFVPDAEGRFTAEGILPGTYRVGIVIGDYRNSGDQILSRDEFTVLSDQELTGDFHFVRSRMRVRLLGPDGEVPLRSTAVIFEGEAFSVRRTTNEDGWVVLDPAPHGPIHLQVRVNAGGYQHVGPLEIPAGEREATFELKVGG